MVALSLRYAPCHEDGWGSGGIAQRIGFRQVSGQLELAALLPLPIR